jgi:rhodanese-related sulfurtransferase
LLVDVRNSEDFEANRIRGTICINDQTYPEVFKLLEEQLSESEQYFKKINIDKKDTIKRVVLISQSQIDFEETNIVNIMNSLNVCYFFTLV